VCIYIYIYIYINICIYNADVDDRKGYLMRGVAMEDPTSGGIKTPPYIPDERQASARRYPKRPVQGSGSALCPRKRKFRTGVPPPLRVAST